MLCATSSTCPAVTLFLNFTATELALPVKPLLCWTACAEVAAADGWTVTVALADLEGAATLVALTVTVVVVSIAGAVNRPAEIVPAVAVQVTP